MDETEKRKPDLHGCCSIATMPVRLQAPLVETRMVCAVQGYRKSNVRTDNSVLYNRSPARVVHTPAKQAQQRSSTNHHRRYKPTDATRHSDRKEVSYRQSPPEHVTAGSAA